MGWVLRTACEGAPDSPAKGEGSSAIQSMLERRMPMCRASGKNVQKTGGKADVLFLDAREPPKAVASGCYDKVLSPGGDAGGEAEKG